VPTGAAHLATFILLAEWRLGIPLGRLAEPSDQAAFALFVAGEGARHITGQDLAVDGGQTIV
jgi:2,3-dihydro-2,3-dihydroxybenzoate dehydrogenase